MPKVVYTKSKGLIQETGSGFETKYHAVLTGGAATSVADSAAALAIDADADSGTARLVLLDGATKVLTITAGAPIGSRIRLVQNVALIASGILRIDTVKGTETFAVGSYARCVASTGSGKVATAAHNRLQVTGANTHSSWGIASIVDLTKVSSTQWLIEAEGAMLGTGKADAFAFSTET